MKPKYQQCNVPLLQSLSHVLGAEFEQLRGSPKASEQQVIDVAQSFPCPNRKPLSAQHNHPTVLPLSHQPSCKALRVHSKQLQRGLAAPNKCPIVPQMAPHR